MVLSGCAPAAVTVNTGGAIEKFVAANARAEWSGAPRVPAAIEKLERDHDPEDAAADLIGADTGFREKFRTVRVASGPLTTAEVVG
jgi:hypothetical protein